MSDFWVPVLASAWMLTLGLWLAAIARIATARAHIEVDAADRLARMADPASKITGGLTVACLIVWGAS